MECYPTFTRETKENAKKIQEIQAKFEKDPRVKAFGYNDYSTFKWLYNKYVGKPFDIANVPINKTDIRKFEEGWFEFSNNIGKKENEFARWFKLPKALMRKLPETATFVEGISNATSFRQRNLKESAINLNNIFTDLYSMVTNGDYHNGVAWSKSEFKKYQKLEQKLELARTPNERMAAVKDIVDVVGIADSNNNPVGGKILRRFNDLVSFKEGPKTETERSIVREWNDLRKRSAKLLLNGIEQSKAIIKTVNDASVRKDLMAAMEKLQAAAERVHFQQSVDAKIIKDPSALFDIKKHDITVFDAETGTTKPYRVIDAKGERVIPREMTKYSPEYVVEMANVVRQVTDYASNMKDAKWEGKSSAEIRKMIDDKMDLGRMINRLKARTDVDNGKFSSLDPIFYLNKYVQDIAHFNYVTRVNLEYKKAADKMWELTREGKGRELGEYAEHMGKILTEIRDSSLNNYEGSMTEMDSVVRWINGMEYISKLGWSVRGGLRNLSQMTFDWVRYGTKGIVSARHFYDKGEHGDMASRQMKRFGILFGEKAQAGAPLRIAENLNRTHTFRRAFAMSYQEMTKSFDYYKKEWMDQRKTTDPPSNEQVEKHIEFLAGNMAAKSVRDLHYEYDNWAKAKALQTKTGKVVGQFQTYRFALWDMQWQMLQGAARASKAGKYGLFETDPAGNIVQIMPEIQQAMRYLSLYSFIVPAIATVSNFDLTNLVQNETYDTINRFYQYYTANELDEAELEGKYGQFFGKGVVTGNLGPFASDLLTFADLMDWWDQTPEELQETMKLKYDPDDPDWWYKMARIFNIQGARAGWHTMPALLAGQEERAFRVETGLYKPKHLFKWLKDDESKESATYKIRQNWLDESPYSPKRLYTGKFLPEIKGKRRKRRGTSLNDRAIAVLDDMLGDRY